MEKKIWTQLEKDILERLESISIEQGLAFRNSYQAIIGFPSDGFRSDGMVIIGDILIAIEVEAGQMHPDTNVGKYWFLQKKYKEYDKIFLFHIFTPTYNSYNWRKELANFYAEKMKDDIPFEYNLIDERNNEDYTDVLERCWGEIEIKIMKQLNK